MVVKPPVRFQFCRECAWSEEQAHRWDRRRQVYRSFWLSTHCPQCGGQLVQQCPACDAPIETADAVSCPVCREPFPWRRAASD